MSRQEYRNIKPVGLKWIILADKIIYPILNYNLYKMKYKMYADAKNMWDQIFDIENIEVR